MDSLEANLDIAIQHVHFNTETLQCEGSEFRAPEWPAKPVDGMFYHPETNEVCLLEVLGDYWHGHPRFRLSSKRIGHGGVPLEDRFAKTEQKLLKLKTIGSYRVIYIWESDFAAWTGDDKLWPCWREFTDKLEY